MWAVEKNIRPSHVRLKVVLDGHSHYRMRMLPSPFLDGPYSLGGIFSAYKRALQASLNKNLQIAQYQLQVSSTSRTINEHIKFLNQTSFPLWGLLLRFNYLRWRRVLTTNRWGSKIVYVCYSFTRTSLASLYNFDPRETPNGVPIVRQNGNVRNKDTGDLSSDDGLTSS